MLSIELKKKPFEITGFVLARPEILARSEARGRSQFAWGEFKEDLRQRWLALHPEGSRPKTASFKGVLCQQKF